MNWELESAVERHRAHPDFWIPSAEQRSSLGPGWGAKLLFRLPGGVERMWVLIEEVVAPGRYRGRLDSTPGTPGYEHARGALVEFAAEHVCDVAAAPQWRELLAELARGAERTD